MKRKKNIYDLIQEGPVYLINEYENAVFRTENTPVGKVYCKFKGETEFIAQNDSCIYHDVLSIHYMITKEEYEKF